MTEIGGLSRRTVLVGAASMLGSVACNDRAAQAQSEPSAPPVRSLSQLGVDRLATRDQHAALQRAFDAAREGGFALLADSEANYRHDGTLRLHGVSFNGQGCTFTSISDGPRALRLTGSGWRIANLRLLGGSRVRTSDPDRNGVTVGDDRPASDFVLENVTVDGVGPGRGVSGGGIYFNNVSRGRIIRPTVRNTLADGIHVTGGSHDLLFERTLSENTGDDGFAVVSYVSQGQVCRNIRLAGGISRNTRARGFSVIGGRDVVFENPQAQQTAAAGLYLYGEDGWDTYGVQRCRFVDPVVLGCVTGRGLDAHFLQGAVLIGGRGGEDMVNGEMLPRASTQCQLVRPVIRGAGSSCTAGIVTHEYAVGPRITGARLSDIVSGNPSFTPNGIEIGGRDVVVENVEMTNIAGLAAVVTRSASGECVLADARVSGCRLAGRGPDSFIHVDQAKELKHLKVRDGTFARGPAHIATEAAAGQLRVVRSKLG